MSGELSGLKTPQTSNQEDIENKPAAKPRLSKKKRIVDSDDEDTGGDAVMKTNGSVQNEAGPSSGLSSSCPTM